MQPILCGDSIFSRLFESYSYHFHPVSAEFCISGQTIGGLKKLVKERSSDLKGNKVIVMIGTNDFKSNCFHHSKSEMRAFLKLFSRLGSCIATCEILPLVSAGSTPWLWQDSC